MVQQSGAFLVLTETQVHLQLEIIRKNVREVGFIGPSE